MSLYLPDFLFNNPAPTAIYTLSLHDALPICKTTNLQHIYQKTAEQQKGKMISLATETDRTLFFDFLPLDLGSVRGFKTRDRKSTRLNSSHQIISYAVFCSKKKMNPIPEYHSY